MVSTGMAEQALCIEGEFTAVAMLYLVLASVCAVALDDAKNDDSISTPFAELNHCTEDVVCDFEIRA